MTQEKFLRQNIFTKPKDKSLKTAFASIATVPVHTRRESTLYTLVGLYALTLKN